VNFDIGYELLLPALQFFAKVTNSWGWPILLLTLLVRIAVWPLVIKSTQSMKRMSKLQPQINALKTRYKSDPELFQKKSMEFFQKNKVNPMSGCWPLLIQMPVLFALYATFTGPPFTDRLIDVKVMVVDKQHETGLLQAPTSGGNSPYISPTGVAAKVVVFPGDSTVAVDHSVDFGVRAVEGQLASDFAPTWKIASQASRNPGDPGVAADLATIDAHGRATFLKPGEYHVQALIPGIAKNERFLLVNGLGKIAHGQELLQPHNWDNLLLILLFGASMYWAQKFSVATPASTDDMDDEQKEQMKIQQQTMKTMPAVTTIMFMVMPWPMPTGVLLYLVVSNVLQTLQTWLVMRLPSAELIDVTADDAPPATSTNGSGKPKPSAGTGGSTAGGANASSGKRKGKRKKN
jgi:YidC/Oxa1 family membrane protein insertase